VSGRSFVATVTACLALGGIAACATEVSGRGTGAGPRDGPPAASTAGASASVPPASSAAPSSAPATSGAPHSSGPATHPVPSQPLRTVTARGSNGTNYVVKLWAQTETKACAAHAYGGPVINFLKRNPCLGMRSLLATTTVHGRAVGFAQRSIGFQGTSDGGAYRTAGAFRQLVSRSGTGNLNDLLREGYQLPSGPTQVPFPNAFNAQAQDNGVTVVEAWYLQGSTPDNDPALERMEQDIFLQV
jgi:hypothetical protein